jgi:triacylglycerol lipase
MTSAVGRIAGPSGFDAPAPGAQGGGRGPGGPGRGGPQLTPEQQAERDNLPGFKKSNVKIALAYAELDPGIMNAQMPANTVALHDEMCTVGKDHCPAMWMLKGESHMSEVFSLDTPDQVVAKPVLEFVKKAK